jgi:hypothetical protein
LVFSLPRRGLAGSSMAAIVKLDTPRELYRLFEVRSETDMRADAPISRECEYASKVPPRARYDINVHAFQLIDWLVVKPTF